MVQSVTPVSQYPAISKTPEDPPETNEVLPVPPLASSSSLLSLPTRHIHTNFGSSASLASGKSASSLVSSAARGSQVYLDVPETIPSPAGNRNAPLLIRLVEPSPRPKPPKVPCSTKIWGARGVCLMGAATSFTLWALSYFYWNSSPGAVAASFFFGALAQASISFGFSDYTAARIRQYTLSLFGILGLCSIISEAFANVNDQEAKDLLSYLYVAAFGVNLTTSIAHMLQDDPKHKWKLIRIESQSRRGEESLPPFWYTHPQAGITDFKKATLIRLLSCATAGGLFFSYDHPNLKKLTAFCGSFYGLKLLFTLLMRGLNYGIRKHDKQVSSYDSAALKGTVLREIKIGGLTVMYIMAPLIPVIFSFYQEIVAFIMFGGSLGAADGFFHEAENERYGSLEPNEFARLEELQLIEQLREETDSQTSQKFLKAHQYFKKALHAAVLLNLSGFYIWQEVTLPSERDKIDIRIMIAGSWAMWFLERFLTAKITRGSWLKDKLSRRTVSTVRLFDMPVVHAFWAGQTILGKTDSRAVNKYDTFGEVLASFTLFFSSVAAMWEFLQSASERQGTPDTKATPMLWKTGTATALYMGMKPTR